MVTLLTKMGICLSRGHRGIPGELSQNLLDEEEKNKVNCNFVISKTKKLQNKENCDNERTFQENRSQQTPLQELVTYTHYLYKKGIKRNYLSIQDELPYKNFYARDLHRPNPCCGHLDDTRLCAIEERLFHCQLATLLGAVLLGVVLVTPHILYICYHIYIYIIYTI